MSFINYVVEVRTLAAVKLSNTLGLFKQIIAFLF